MKIKNLLFSISAVSGIIVIVFIVLGTFRVILSNNLTKKEIFSLVVKHEELFRSVLVEITESELDVKYISTTQKSKLYDPENAYLEGLYIRRDISTYENYNNDTISKAMKLKGLRSISVRSNIVEFDCGGSGFGSASSDYGFFYTEEENIVDDMGLVQEGNGWLIREENGDNWYYTERIIENFYYYEAHY